MSGFWTVPTWSWPGVSKVIKGLRGWMTLSTKVNLPPVCGNAPHMNERIWFDRLSSEEKRFLWFLKFLSGITHSPWKNGAKALGSETQSRSFQTACRNNLHSSVSILVPQQKGAIMKMWRSGKRISSDDSIRWPTLVPNCSHYCTDTNKTCLLMIGSGLWGLLIWLFVMGMMTLTWLVKWPEEQSCAMNFFFLFFLYLRGSFLASQQHILRLWSQSWRKNFFFFGLNVNEHPHVRWTRDLYMTTSQQLQTCSTWARQACWPNLPHH